jgi:hypothetical protein
MLSYDEIQAIAKAQFSNKEELSKFRSAFVDKNGSTYIIYIYFQMILSTHED